MGAVGASSVSLVIPCFNERQRLRIDDLVALTARDSVSLVLVDDGSTDETLTLLRTIERTVPRVSVVALSSNLGKGEAVRAGLRSARASGSEWVGYADADLSTPVTELERLVDLAAQRNDLDVELRARLLDAGVPVHAFWEEPLLVWHDHRDSRRSLRGSIRSTFDLAPIWLDRRRQG